MALLAQRNRDWGCLLVLPPQTSDVTWGSGSLAGSFRRPALKMRTSADSSQAEGASLKAVAHPHVPMALLAQRHRDWGCLLVLSPQRSNEAWGRVSVLGTSDSPAPKMRTSADISQAEGASLKAVAHPHVPMALLAQRHRDWGCLLVLPPQTSNVA